MHETPLFLCPYYSMVRLKVHQVKTCVMYRYQGSVHKKALVPCRAAQSPHHQCPILSN